MSERRIYLGTALGLFLVTFVAYLETMGGRTSFWDCGEFIATAFSLGIPHPPATPLYVVLGRVFSLLPLPIAVAQKINMMSALFGALGIAVLFILIVDFIRERRGAPKTNVDRVVIYGCGLVGALFTAWSNTYWTNCVEAEVYAISSFVMGVTTILARRWSRDPASPSRTRDIYLVVYLLSLGVGFHLGTVLTYPAIALYCLTFRKKAFQDRDLVIFSFGFFLFLFYVNLKFQGPPAALALLLFAIAFAVRTASKNRFVPVTTGLFVLGITIHLFLLIRSAHQPAIDEADPETWSNLLAVIRRDQYPPGDMFARKGSWHFQFIDHFWRYFKEQYELVKPGGGISGQRLALFPILIGLAGMWSMFKAEKRGFLLIFVTFLVCSFGLILFLNFSDGAHGVQAEVRERDYFYSAAFYFFGIFIGTGAAALLDWFFLARPGERRLRIDLVGSIAGVALLLGLTGMLYKRYHFEHDRTGERVPWGYGYNMFAGLEPNAIIFTNGDNDTFPLWYQQEVEGFRKDVRVCNLSLLNTPWYIHQLKYNEPKVAINWTDDQIANLQGYQDRDGRIVQPRDIAVRQIVRDNFGKRPIYFAVTIPREGVRDVEDYLVLEGLVYRVTDTKGKDRKDYDKIEQNARHVYRYDGLLTADFKRDDSIYRDENQTNLVQNYAGAFIRVAQHAEERADSTLDETQRMALYDKAETNYRQALEISPDFDVLYAQLGALYIKEGRSQQALEMYERQVKEHPGDDRWEFQVVQGLFASYREEEGLTRLRALAVRRPDQEYVQEYFVQVLWEMGQAASAEQAVQQYETLKPGDHALRDYLNAVKAHLVEPLLGRRPLTGGVGPDSAPATPHR